MTAATETTTGRGRKLLALMLWMVPMSIVRGLVLAKLWEWFVADTFGVDVLSVVEAMGLSTITTYVGSAWGHAEEEPVSLTVFRSLLASTLAIVFGLVLVQFA